MAHYREVDVLRIGLTKDEVDRLDNGEEFTIDTPVGQIPLGHMSANPDEFIPIIEHNVVDRLRNGETVRYQTPKLDVDEVTFESDPPMFAVEWDQAEEIVEEPEFVDYVKDADWFWEMDMIDESKEGFVRVSFAGIADDQFEGMAEDERVDVSWVGVDESNGDVLVDLVEP